MTADSPSIVLTGGGTAGHINPMLAVARELRARCPQARISMIGTAQGMEATLVPEAGFTLDTIDKVPFPRALNKQALTFVPRWFAELKRVRRILREREADVVVGFGGYTSAPVYVAAHRLHIPIVMHEQNSRPGMANKLGARWAQYVGTAYADTGLERLVRGDRGIEQVGLPLRAPIAELAQARALHAQHEAPEMRAKGAEHLGIDPHRPCLLVTGGSLGAVSINRAIAQAAPQLLKVAQVIHLTGKGKDDEVRVLVRRSAGEAVLNDGDPRHAGEGDYHVLPYLQRMDWALACADMVVCRAGAGMVSELSALGIPALYVPLPIGNGEQAHNAQPVVAAGGALMVDDAQLTPALAGELVAQVLGSPQELRHMSAVAWRFGLRQGAERMAEQILRIAQHEDLQSDQQK